MTNLNEIALKQTINLIENGRFPDFLTRIGIRKLLTQRLIEINGNSNDAKKSYLLNHIETISNSPLAIKSKEANQQHYEVPTEYYNLCLGDKKKYSSCFWDENTETLEDAEKLALNISINRAEIIDGMNILELGCGWGSLSLELASRFPNSKIIAVSNSKTQKAYIDNIANQKGFKNLTVKTLDLSDSNNYEFDGLKFDRIMSIEMMEHLRNYKLFFKLISNVMKSDAKFFVHIFTHKSSPYFFEDEGEDNWMGKYFFSGGQMPSKELFKQFNEDLIVKKMWTWNGVHYQKTLEAWLERHDDNKDKILKLFKNTYGEDQSIVWFNRWRVFYMSCSELFGFNNGEEWDVTHYILEKK